MGTITTTSQTNPLQYPGSRLLFKVIDYNRWVMLLKHSTANRYDVMLSTDGGTSWSSYSNFSRANIQEIVGFVDNQGWLFVAYRTNESSTDRIYARRFETGASNKADTGEVLLGSAANGGVAGAAITGIGVVSHYNNANGYHYVVVAHGITPGGGLYGLSLVCANIDTSGNISDGTYRFSGTRTWTYAGTTGRIGVAIDKEHGGDGLNSTNPNLWVTFGRDVLRVAKVPWSGDGWTGPSGTTLIASGLSARDTLPGLWDGNRFLMVVPDPSAGNTDKVLLYERNRANSSTTKRQTPSHPTGVVRQATMAYDYNSGNCRIYAVGTSTAVLYFIDFIRATASWGAWTAVSGSPVIIGTNVDNFGAKPGTWQDASYGPYYATGVSPFTLTYTPQSQAYPPNIPTWASPDSGTAQDVAAALTLDWNFTDPDSSDTQSKYALSRQIGSGSLSYFRSSDSTWQATEQQNSSTTSAVTLASGWALASDANYTFKVKVWDAANTPSASYSAGLVVVPSAKVNPTVTAPTASQVNTTDHLTLTWTASEQSKYRAQIVDVTGGSVTVYDSGIVNDSATRSIVVPYTLANSRSWQVKLTTYNNEGLASTTQTVAFTTSFTAPSTPTLVGTADPTNGYNSIAITNPGGGSTVGSNDVYRRVQGTTTAVRVATGVAVNGTAQDWRAASGVAYEYQIVALGTNGTSASSAWT